MTDNGKSPDFALRRRVLAVDLQQLRYAVTAADFLPDCRDLKGDPGLSGHALLDPAVSNDEPVDMNPKRDTSSSRQFLRSHISETPRYPVFLASVGCLFPEGLVSEACTCARS
jgi:hypothetical protein